MSCHLAIVAVNAFLVEFRGPRLVTSNGLLSVGGIGSLAMISEEDWKATLGMDTSTSISESVHATSTVGIKVVVAIHLNNVTAEGQTQTNNDFGRGHQSQSLVSGRRSGSQQSERNCGTFHLLPQELQRSMILFGKEQESTEAKCFNDALKTQKEACRKKMRLRYRKNLMTLKRSILFLFTFMNNIIRSIVG